MRERGADVEGELKPVMMTLIRKERLDPTYRPHKLSGNWSDHWECHLKNDWLLIWRTDQSQDRITFVRTGTHDDLFG